MAKLKYGAVLLLLLVTSLLWYTYHFLAEIHASCQTGSAATFITEPPPNYILEFREDHPYPGLDGPDEDAKTRRLVEKIDNVLIRQELHKILRAREPPNSRAAFDKVVALSSLLPPFTNISRMQTPNPEAFRNYIAPMGLPVIFTDMLEGEHLGRWTWEYVRSKWGKTVYQNIRQGNFSTKVTKSGKHLVNRVTVTLEDFIDVVTGKRRARKNESGLYIAKKRVIPVEALEAEFVYPPFYAGSHKSCYLEPTGW